MTIQAPTMIHESLITPMQAADRAKDILETLYAQADVETLLGDLRGAEITRVMAGHWASHVQALHRDICSRCLGFKRQAFKQHACDCKAPKKEKNR